MFNKMLSAGLLTASLLIAGPASAAPLMIDDLEPLADAQTGSGEFSFVDGLGLIGLSGALTGFPDGDVFFDAFDLLGTLDAGTVDLVYDVFGDPANDDVFDIVAFGFTDTTLQFELATTQNGSGDYPIGGLFTLAGNGFDFANQSPIEYFNANVDPNFGEFIFEGDITVQSIVPPSPVPLPAGAVLLVSALLGMGALRKTRRKST